MLRASSFIWLRCCYPSPSHLPTSLPFLPPPAAPGSHPAGDTAQDDAKEQLGLKECPHWAQAPGASPKHQPELGQLWDYGSPLDPSLSQEQGCTGQEAMPRASDKPLAALPMGAWSAGQSWVSASPAAVVVLPAPAAGVSGRWPQLTQASCFPQQQGRGLLRPLPLATPREDSAW